MRRKPWRRSLLQWKTVLVNSQKVQPIPVDGLCYVLRDKNVHGEVMQTGVRNHRFSANGRILEHILTSKEENRDVEL